MEENKLKANYKFYSFFFILFLLLWVVGCGGGETLRDTFLWLPDNNSVNTGNVTPTSVATEKIAITEVVNQFAAAAIEKSPEKMANYFAPEVKNTYLAVFNDNKDQLSKFSEVMKNPKMNFISEEKLASDNHQSRISEMEVIIDGITFYVRMIKIDGQWKIKIL